MKKFLIACLTFVTIGMLLGGCDLLGTPGETASNNPVISQLQVADTLEVRKSYAVTGEVSAAQEITAYKYEIVDSSGSAAFGITVTGPDIRGDKNHIFAAQELIVTVDSTVTAGRYTLKIIITAGERGSGQVSFFVKGSTVIDTSAITNPPVISKLKVSDTLEAKKSYPVTGEVSADLEITAYSYEVVDNSGSLATGITVSGPDIRGEKHYIFAAQELKIIVDSTVTAGRYTLKITVNAGVTGSANVNFFVKRQSTPVEIATLRVGANASNEYGSSIDLDAGVVYDTVDVKKHESEIDLCYAYSVTSRSEKIGTAQWAKQSGYSFARSLYQTPVQFHQIVMNISDFSAITAKEQLPSLFDAFKVDNSFECKTGYVFIVKTTAGKFALIRVSLQVEGSAGYMEIKIVK